VRRSISNQALETSKEFAALMLRRVDRAVKLLRAILLQAFHTVRSECQVMDRLELDLCSAGLSASG
jgi:hypothetical protein